jgi:hypothetical protein
VIGGPVSKLLGVMFEKPEKVLKTAAVDANAQPYLCVS